MAAFMTAGALTSLDVIVKLTLGLRGNLVAVDCGLQIGSLEAGRKFGGLFVAGAMRQVGRGRALSLIASVLVLIPSLAFFVFVLSLIALFFGGLGLDGIEDIRDWRFDAAKVRWV